MKTDVQGAVPVAWRRQAVGGIEERFPGVRAWWGAATGAYWAYVPSRDGRWGALVEAAAPRELADLVSVRWGRR